MGELRSTVDDIEDFNSFIFRALVKLPSHNHKVAAMMVWAIWKMRNDKVWEDVNTSVMVAVRKACENLLEWEVARSRQREDQHAQCVHAEVETRWIKSFVGNLKCNMDAAIFNQEGRDGIGMCIRNDQESFVKAKTMTFDGIPLPQ